ncbi:MAG: DUF4422 domain-containing protein [Anaerorhabdus sp.]|uniref:DUF4422 domain-containing protein n=1 Tax=Anaerorhabdus sp. TaxID=1872524 RepID=UPI002FC63BD7
MTAIKILTVSHKEYWLPKDDLYLPIQVGFAKSLGITRDDTGENISSKNKNYCELTALYWAWKNLDADYIGLDHYRRHFSSKRFGDKKDRIIKTREILKILENVDIILPKKRHYWIETNESQYIHAHNKKDLVILEEVLKEKYPEYMDDYKKVMKRTYGHRFNMMIMKYEILNDYCQFLFDVLFEIEKRIDISSYSSYDARIYGFLSERLLDVWINKNSKEYKEISYVYMENENWIKKIYKFLERKVRGKNDE